MAELDRVLASALARAQSHPRKAQISKLTRELNALRRECDSDPQCIKDLQRSLIHHYMDDFGLTFSLPAWAASEGISANARCRGTALTDLSSFPFTLRKGDDIDFVAYEDNGSERSYIVDRMGRIGAANIRLKDPRCILRRY